MNTISTLLTDSDKNPIHPLISSCLVSAAIRKRCVTLRKHRHVFIIVFIIVLIIVFIIIFIVVFIIVFIVVFIIIFIIVFIIVFIVVFIIIFIVVFSCSYISFYSLIRGGVDELMRCLCPLDVCMCNNSQL